MARIGGNTTIQLQTCSTSKNAIGEKVQKWATVNEIVGWLDLSAGDSKYSTYNAKIQESTHIFICDYVALESDINAENTRVIDENGKRYDVMLIDDPLTMHQQLEIYLKYIGGQ